MEYTYTDTRTRFALDHLSDAMNKFNIDSQEYKLAQRAFRYICNRVRLQEKVNAEALKN